MRKVAFSGRFANGSIDHDENITAVIIKGILISLVDIVLVVTVGVLTFYLFAGYLVSPIENGFYCDDTSIANPLLPHTITTRHLLTVTLGVPIIVIFIGEIFFFGTLTDAYRNRLRKYFSFTTGLFLTYLLAFTTATFVMEAGKCAFGRLRPHFLDACQPNWTLVDCKTDVHRFIQQAHCTGSYIQVRTARGSFPSGHSAAAILLFTFLYYYLTELAQICNRNSRIQILRLIILPIVGIWTIVCCISRITDYWHHPSDVCGGIALGFICAYVAFGRRTLKQALNERTVD